MRYRRQTDTDKHSVAQVQPLLWSAEMTVTTSMEKPTKRQCYCIRNWFK